MSMVVKGQFLWMCECVREDGGDGKKKERKNEKIKGRCWQIERRNGRTRSKDRKRTVKGYDGGMMGRNTN